MHTILKSKSPVIGLCGHCGCGHAHSHNGFTQDDSAGFAVVASILKQAMPLDTAIRDISSSPDGKIKIVLNCGGAGHAVSAAGFTPFEKDLLKKAVGLDAVLPQALGMKLFGRVYGQGAMETATAVITAASLAVVDGFVRHYSDRAETAIEHLEGSCGISLGTVIDIRDISTAVLLVINASKGGLGPVEDLEGNSASGPKADLMKNLGLFELPTLVVESKAYVPYLSDDLTGSDSVFMIRANEEYDNVIVAESIQEAAKKLDEKAIYDIKAYPRHTNALKNACTILGDKIIELGQKLKEVESSVDKVILAAQLNQIARSDFGGVSFMSNRLNDIVGGAGIIPGTSAVLSMVVTGEYINEWIIPVLTVDDVSRYVSLTCKSLGILDHRKDEALTALNRF
ncbi:MAG: hypothetical protein K9K63_04615 [Desulfotignum sp.]|nr:hypothetical protein [Desulfotignum sp.]MCF8088585.1 hypothetical protein [Desulfotignum sp.]MCF8136573.1 hypothetical protein [Desulfotignum sp.]